MASHSGLTHAHVLDARARAVRAASLALHHASAVHYTQGSLRWQGINLGLVASKGKFPHYADCSAFVTWCLWNGLAHYGVKDLVNGQGWHAGYTGTLLEHGKKLNKMDRLGDVVIYGKGDGEHTALYVGGGKVISHGSEGGPYLLPVGYRSDQRRYRRYI